MELLKEEYLLMMLVILVGFETIYTIVKTIINKKLMNEDEIDHVITHILLKIVFIFAIATVQMIGSTYALIVWGMYSLYHLHIENRRLTNGNYHA